MAGASIDLSLWLVCPWIVPRTDRAVRIASRSIMVKFGWDVRCIGVELEVEGVVGTRDVV
jgi:hypothetical protein